MKLILILIAVLLIGAGCGPGLSVATPDELYAQVYVRKEFLPPTLEIIFYSKRQQEGNSMAGTMTVLAVDDPRLNDVPLDRLATEPGKTSYTIGSSGVTNLNTLSAKINGKRFEGRTPINMFQTNQMTAVTMMPK